MMKITVEMPQVARCAAASCAYNIDRGCHAKAVTVGDALGPACDTFLSSKTHAHAPKTVAGVGACKVTDCKHNDDFECGADRIEVGLKGSDVLCLTYAAR